MHLVCCPVCRREPREDDQLQSVQSALGGMTSACRRCVSELTGKPLADPVYPHGQPVPMIHDGMAQRHIRVCGVCRKALRFADADKSIRLERDDVCEAFQTAYGGRVSDAWSRFQSDLAAADSAYAAAVAPFGREFNDQAAELELRTRAAKVDAEARCETAEQWQAIESAIDAQHQRECQQAAQAFEINTAPAAAHRNAARFRAERDYRKVAMDAFEAVKDVLAADTPTIEPGAYIACGDCYGHYGARVRERHARTFVKTGHHLL